MTQRDIKSALDWILDILNKYSIPFQIGGGFAARVYGVDRELYDIDIAIPTNQLEVILPDVAPYIIHNLRHRKDENWEFTGMTVKYNGQEIDLVGAQDKKYLNKKTKEWIISENDFESSEYKEAYGIILPIMPREKLITYKRNLGRDVDIIDIASLEVVEDSI